MRYLIFMLLFSLPCTAEPTVFAPESQVETAIAQQAIPHGFSPKKHRFFERFAEKILQKRLKKALGRSNEGAVKLLSIFGLTCSALGIILLLVYISGAATLSFVASLALIGVGFLLSSFGFALSSSDTAKWVKALAISGIVLFALLVLFFYLLLIGVVS